MTKKVLWQKIIKKKKNKENIAVKGLQMIDT
jgi:hypothetical protein